MIKLWPSTPTLPAMDQMTPRAGVTANPFEAPSSPASAHHPLLTPTRLSVANPFDLTPGSPTSAPAARSAFAAALPTTGLTLHAPDFNMQRSKPTTPSPPPPLTASRGQIHVKLIQARGLNVHSSSARPYVVVQFEQNEFVSRDPTDESDKESKACPLEPPLRLLSTRSLGLPATSHLRRRACHQKLPAVATAPDFLAGSARTIQCGNMKFPCTFYTLHSMC